MANTSWKTIAADLEGRISSGELPIGARLPPGEQIAETWGVSRHTAHRAIEELQRKGLVVRQRRWGTVVSDQSAQHLGRVALLVDRFAQAYNFPSGELIRGIQDALGHDIDMVLAESKSDPEVEVRQLRKFQGHIDGVILYPTVNGKSTQAILRFVESGTPLVILDRVPSGVAADSVMTDNTRATEQAVAALLERGHRRIGFFSFHKPEFSSVNERYEGYRTALQKAGIADVSGLARWFARELDSTPQSFVQAVYDSLFTLLNQPEPITALFCVQDSFATAALQACDRIGVGIPRDFELATFNDWPPMMLRTPWAIHRIVQRTYEIGFQAGDLLGRRIKSGPGEVECIRVQAEFFPAEAG
jgi:GntR family transcriptional regulator of arabinose operon